MLDTLIGTEDALVLEAEFEVCSRVSILGEESEKKQVKIFPKLYLYLFRYLYIYIDLFLFIYPLIYHFK